MADGVPAAGGSTRGEPAGRSAVSIAGLLPRTRDVLPRLYAPLADEVGRKKTLTQKDGTLWHCMFGGGGLDFP